jgi:hypothetical protein
MLLIGLDTSAVFMWCCIVWGSVSVWSAGGLTLVNRLQSFRRCKAVCSSFSGQLHSGEGTLFLFIEVGAETAVVCQELCKDIVWPEG